MPWSACWFRREFPFIEIDLFRDVDVDKAFPQPAENLFFMVIRLGLVPTKLLGRRVVRRQHLLTGAGSSAQLGVLRQQFPFLVGPVQ